MAHTTPTYQERRKMTPSNAWTRLNEWIGRYRVVWYLVVGILLTLGFDFKTPASQIKASRAADSVQGVRIDSVVRALGTRDLITMGLARYFCFKDRDGAQLFLPCSYMGSSSSTSPPP